MTNKYKLTIAYDGTEYGGWQIQPNVMAIQQKIQDTLKIFLKKEIQLTGSGRTDAGVHARGQTAHFTWDTEIDCSHFLKVSNSLLPKDIRIKEIEPVHPSFHARYGAKSKIYHYHIFLDPILDPFRRFYVLHLRRKFDLIACKQAAALFVGEHDFTSFANEPGVRCNKRNPIRTLKRLDIIEEEGGIRLEFESKGFLYKMVRNIVGTLIEVGTHRCTIAEIETIFAAKNREAAGLAVPPQGLFLYKVEY